MGILEIKNRTENWKTAHTFAPFFADENLRLRLVQRLGEPSTTKADEVKLELFWKGMRDHLEQQRPSKRSKLLSQSTVEDLASRYTQLCLGLREKIEAFQSKDGRAFECLNPRNYCESPLCHQHENIDLSRKLGENLMNTEIDIVLETPNNLFIGEAKDESDFDGNSDLVLVHQLIRQYVMAKILVDLRGTGQEVVPFIVWGGVKRHMPAQIQFMLEQKWLRPENILTWKKVESLVSGHA